VTTTSLRIPAQHDCEAGGELSKIITWGAGRSLVLVVADDADTLASGFGGWQADARRARREGRVAAAG
jgi:S-DNA-T family DNA segregation ATPase FtsK/SpoIIIE